MIADLILRSLTPRIAPMVYVMMFVSMLIGFFFLTGIDMSGQESIIYGTGVLFDRQIWGGLLLITASLAETGLIFKNRWLVSTGGIAGFSLWAFAAISVFIAGHFYIFLTVAMFHLLFHGYVVCASAVGVLEREKVLTIEK